MIIVENYNYKWKEEFKAIEKFLRKVIPAKIKIEHIGSTSVEGLAAKPIIDIVIVAEEKEQEEVIIKLESIGYTHRGFMGIEGRHAFKGDSFIESEFMNHHLYLGSINCISIQNFFYLRNFLRKNPHYVTVYGNLKKENAKKYDDIDLYIDAKSDLIKEILLKAGMSKNDVEIIFEVNTIDD